MKRLLAYSMLMGLSVGNEMSAWASGAGTTAADFLKIPVGARAIAMGEAFTAQADDASSLYWNPAGLALMRERQASFMYSPMVQDMTFQNANIGIPLENGAIGGSLSYLNYGDITGYDQTGASTGELKAYDAVATLGASWLGNQWSAGANLKGIQESLAGEKANGVAFDLGANVIYPKPVLGGTIRFAGVARNLGSGMKFEQQKDKLPTDWRLGVAAVEMMGKKLNLSLDYAKPLDDEGATSGGVEYWVTPNLALRTGYINTNTEGSGIRAGIGLRVKGVSFDYAYAGQGDLGMNHRYEVSFRFGEPRPILSAEEAKMFQQAKAAMRQNRYEQAILLLDSVIELEPHFKPARRIINTAMAKLEGQNSQMLARQGKVYQPGGESASLKPALPEMDDLEALLNLGSAHTAQASDKPKGAN